VIPADQTRFGSAEGNCFSACVASILEIPLEDVPQFMVGDWWANFTAWCEPRGIIPKYWPARGWCDLDPVRVFLGVPTGYAIMSGESPRHPGVLHAVVALDGAIAHDPHPSRAGIRGDLEHHDFVTLERAAVLL
jgi:hypothetical protein